MDERKHPGRFTLQFNMEDPRQRDAAELLRQQGRRKAQFLTSAILSYAGDPDESEQGIRPSRVDMETLRRMVVDILCDSPQGKLESHPVPENIVEPDAPSEETADANDPLAAMANTLAAFRRK